MRVVNHARENPAMYITAAAIITLLGGSVIVELPADKAIKEVRIEMAQNYENREQQYQQQQRYHRKNEIEDIDFRMEWTSNEINRLNQIPVYLNRALTAEEKWTIEQRKQEWSTLQGRREELSQ